jgi:hypothetical protein
VPRADRAKGGRPPFDHVLMFKVLILQSSHNLSDERTEYPGLRACEGFPDLELNGKVRRLSEAHSIGCTTSHGARPRPLAELGRGQRGGFEPVADHQVVGQGMPERDRLGLDQSGYG